MVIAALVKSFCVLADDAGEPILYFLEEFLVLLVDMEDEVFEGGTHLFLLTSTFNSYFMQALPQNFLLSFLLDQ